MWLTRVTALRIGERNLNFTVLGPTSPWSSVDTTGTSMTHRASTGGRWLIDDGGVGGERAVEQFSTATRRRAFRTYQMSGSDCPAPACLLDIWLQGGDNTVLSFVLPALDSTGYLPLTLSFKPVPLTASDPTPAPANWTGSDWIFVSVVPCPSGWLTPRNACVACPTGGYCPGGGRVWPLPGYWSFSETSEPSPCALPRACTGALTPSALTVSGMRDTQQCATGYVSISIHIHSNSSHNH